MYELLLFNDKNAKQILLSEFEGHSVEEHIKKLDIEGLADFIRHILAANRSHIGWEVVDEMNSKLDKKFTPSWKKPNFNFEDGFSQLHSMIIRWDDFTRYKYLRQDLQNYHDQFKLDDDLFEKFASDNKLWNVTDLLRLHNLCVEISIHEYLPSKSPFESLIFELSDKFIKIINDKIYPLYTRVALALLYVRYRVSLANDYVRPMEELLDKLWREVEKESDNVVKSLRYIFGAGYAIVGLRIFNSSNDFVSRRRLLGGLLSNFVNIPKFPLLSWFNLVKGRDTHPSIILLILNGYSDLAEIISTHYQEFPESETKEQLYLLNQNIIKTLLEVIELFIINKTELDWRQNKLTEFVDNLATNASIVDYRRDLFTVWVRIIKFYIFTSGLSTDEKLQYRDLGYELLRYCGNELTQKLYKLDIDFYLNQYPFQDIFVEIEKEIQLSSSIILSTTFEYKVIQEISSLMDYLLKESTKSGIIRVKH